MKASAYLSIFDDWDILPEALATIYDRVEEIVVVDGAYEWMAPFFRGTGRDPAYSAPQLREALAPFAPKLRFINRLWRNEIEKRRAGYAACRNRYVFRVDADEVLFFDDAALDAFLGWDGGGVANMEMPIYVAPGWIRKQGPRDGIEQQSFLFDQHKVSADRHVDYLWLVMPKDEEVERRPIEWPIVSAFPIAFNAHLTQWRPPTTALTRARFYIMNYFREHRKIPWAPGVQYDDASGFDRLFERVTPQQVTDILMGTDIVAGPVGLRGGGIYPTPLTPEQERRFAHLYDRQRAGLAALNADSQVRPRTLPAGTHYSVDVSTDAARVALGDGRTITLEFSSPIAASRAHVTWTTCEAPFTVRRDLQPEVNGKRVSIPLDGEVPAGMLSGAVQFAVWPLDRAPLVAFQAVPEVVAAPVS